MDEESGESEEDDVRTGIGRQSWMDTSKRLIPEKKEKRIERNDQ